MKYLLAVLIALSGCMQVVGAKKIDVWGLKIEANSGLDLGVSAMQYDQADNRKVMGK